MAIHNKSYNNYVLMSLNKMRKDNNTKKTTQMILKNRTILKY